MSRRKKSPLPPIELLNQIRFKGALEGKDLSAVAMFNDFALAVSDEGKVTGNLLQFFEPDGDQFKAAKDKTIRLDAPRAGKSEMDLEGLAVDGHNVYIIGSHSKKRTKVDPAADYQTNREALTGPPKAAKARDVLIRCTFTAAGALKQIHRSASLRTFLNKTEPFKTYGKLASKENGVDIEGLTIYRGWLYIGFRGPVLRGNFVPIIKCKFDTRITQPEVLFVNLGGRGIRELTQVDDGLIILAGPVGDGPGSFQLYFWDAQDGVPGLNGPAPTADSAPHLIGDLPLPPSTSTNPPSVAKPEGLTCIKETTTHWEFLVIFDGLKNGHATRYRVKK